MIDNTPFYDEQFDGEVDDIKKRYKKGGLSANLDRKLFVKPNHDIDPDDDDIEDIED